MCMFPQENIVKQQMDRATYSHMVRQTEIQPAHIHRVVAACPELHRHAKLKHKGIDASQFGMFKLKKKMS